MIDFSGRIALAPLAGISDTVFRLICRRMGADVVWSEMVSADGLVYSPENHEQVIRFDEEQRPVVIQLFGADPGIMGAAAALVAERRPDAIDINFGCPVKKVVRRNGGASLMRDPALIGRITSAVVENARDIPVCGKIRSGWSAGEINYLTTGRIIVESGARAVCLHPRTRVQAFSGRSEWEHIAELAAELPVPVIGSGDIVQPEDALRMLESTSCAAAMIGRAAMGNPWLFGRARAVVDGRDDPGEPTLSDRLDVALRHTRMMVDFRGPYGIVLMRRHYACYTRGLPGSAALRRRLFAAKTLEDVERVFSEYMEERECVRS